VGSAGTAGVLALRARRVPYAGSTYASRWSCRCGSSAGLFVVGASPPLVPDHLDRSRRGRRFLVAAPDHAGRGGDAVGDGRAGMLTFTGVVFSTTLVAIQLAGGPVLAGVVRVFVRSTLTARDARIFSPRSSSR